MLNLNLCERATEVYVTFLLLRGPRVFVQQRCWNLRCVIISLLDPNPVQQCILVIFLSKAVVFPNMLTVMMRTNRRDATNPPSVIHDC